MRTLPITPVTEPPVWSCGTVFLIGSFWFRDRFMDVLYKTAHSSFDDFSFPISLGSSTTTIKCVESIASALMAWHVQAIEAIYIFYKNDLG